jgi:hypothetical protein
MSDRDLEREQEEAAAAEAARIGGSPGDEPYRDGGEEVDEAHRPLEEAGQGEAEGFELSEQELIEHASHGDMHAARRAADEASDVSEDARATQGGDADEEQSSELDEDTP